MSSSTRRKRIPKVKWKPPETHATGSVYWESPDGFLRLVRSDRCYDVPMPTKWKLWKYKHGTWYKILECRSRKRAERFAAITLLESETEE